jgi:hypothetical protein
MPCQMKLLRTRRRVQQQIDLFAGGPWATGEMPAWSELPMQTQAALIDLMTRLILDHADKNKLGSTKEAGHDL